MNIKKLAGICLCLCLSVYGAKAEAFPQRIMTTTFSVEEQQEDFAVFLERFTTSASFQYERVRFPLTNSILLLDEDGETEHTFPFTREKWALLDAEMLRPERMEMEDGSIYLARYLADEADRKEFEAGYEESEVILRVVFDRIDGEWYLTDGYFIWYGYDLLPSMLEETIAGIAEDNEIFEVEYP